MEMMDEFLQAKDDQERAGLADEIQQALKKIHHHGKRADQIVKNMLLHSRTRSLEKESVQLNQLSTEMSDLAYHGTRAIDPGFRCKIEYRLDENLPQVSVNKQDIGRVLLNIFSNSFYALSKKRSMDSSGSFQAELLVETFKKENNLLIHIRDNGVGIPKKIQQHIFEPFFTTKPTGEGTGLGLSLSYDIITKDHQGKIEIESEEGVFTEFRITLPLST
jgi:signal transduction histidine kinase